MSPDQRESFGAMLVTLGEAFGKTITGDLAAIYWQALEGLPSEAVQTAINAHVRKSGFFPKISELYIPAKAITDERIAFDRSSAFLARSRRDEQEGEADRLARGPGYLARAVELARAQLQTRTGGK